VSTQIQIRRDTTANWEGVNPVLADGEIGFDTVANRFKVGNGVDEWATIEYSGGANGSELVDGDAYIRLEDGAWVASPSMTFDGDLTVNGNITIDGGQIVDPDGNPSGGLSTHVGPDAPDPAVEGQMWLNSDDGYLYVYYDNAGNPTWMSVEREA
jgi:hypothetical protein